MVDLLKSGRIDTALLCKLAAHPDFVKLLDDMQINVEGIAATQIQNLNAWVDVARAELVRSISRGSMTKSLVPSKSPLCGRATISREQSIKNKNATARRKDMDKLLTTSEYGIRLFSFHALQDLLKKGKIRSKKLLQIFQKNKELYLTTQKEGIWVPISQINAYAYVIRVAGYDKPFDGEWKQKIEYDGFNLVPPFPN